VTNSVARDKRERLVAAACELVYRQGVERTTLADIASAADVRLGNVYYYFKTKDDIIAAVTQAHIDQLEADFAALERRHRSPKARLKALVGVVAERGGSIAQFGCPYGTLCTELVKRANGPLAARLMAVLLGWVEQQFRAMGRRDAHDLAVEFVAAYQGSAVLTSALGQPELITRQARRLKGRIDALAQKGLP
jgi:TetR/AcrR family transcriptional regulator, transcriptional repressor for nem operon